MLSAWLKRRAGRGMDTRLRERQQGGVERMRLVHCATDLRQQPLRACCEDICHIVASAYLVWLHIIVVLSRAEVSTLTLLCY